MFEPNPRIIVRMHANCPPSSKWVPGGNTGEVKGGEERNWPPYLTMPAAQDKCPSNGHSPNVRNRTRDSPLPFLYCKSLLYCIYYCNMFPKRKMPFSQVVYSLHSLDKHVVITRSWLQFFPIYRLKQRSTSEMIVEILSTKVISCYRQ